MNICFLIGESNTGKTQTFHKLHDIMKADVIRFNELAFADMYSFSTRGHKPADVKDDFYSKFEELTTKKTIVLFSMGDYYYDILDVINKEQGQCDLLLCALNQNIKNKSVFENNINKVYSPTYIDHNFDVFNTAQAKSLLSHI